MTTEASELQARFERVKRSRDGWDSILQEAYRLAMPARNPSFGGTRTSGPDRPRRYDDTLAIACRDGARIRHSTVTPMHSRFLRFEPGPHVVRALRERGGDDAVRQGRASLERITDAFFDELNASNFHSQIAAAYSEEQISTGVLRFDEVLGFDAPCAFSFQAVPLDEVYFEVGPEGDVVSVWHVREIKVAMLNVVWPGAEVPEHLAKMGREDATKTCTVIDATLCNYADMTWDHVLMYAPGSAADNAGIAGGGHASAEILMKSKKPERSTPWIVFQSACEPGEVYGTGPVLLALANAQSADVLMKNYLISVGLDSVGMWQCDDDGVINPGAVKLTPGIVIPKAVGSAGLQPLVPPGIRNAAVHMQLLQELRQSIRYAIVGPELPPVDSPSMTASEAKLRMQEANLVRVPENMRVYWQLVQRGLVPRALDILRGRGVVPDVGLRYGMVSIVPVGPLLDAQKQGEAMSAIAGYTLAAQVSPDGTEQAAPAREFAAWLLEKSSYPASLITSKAERDAAAQAQAEQQQAMALAEGAQKAAPMVGAVTKSPELMQALAGENGEPSMAEFMQ